MNRFLTIGMIGTFVLTSIGGAAMAAEAHSGMAGRINRSHDADVYNSAPTAPDVGSGAAVHFVAFSGNANRVEDQMLRNWKGNRFDVVPVGTLDDNALKAGLLDRQRAEPKQVASLQAAIESNRTLADRLKAQNVELNNIIDAQSALDGGITFYVR